MSLLVKFISLIGGVLNWLLNCREREAGEAIQRARDSEESLKAQRDIDVAGNDAPKDKKELIERLKSGSIAVLFCLILAQTSCAQNSALACPIPSNWTLAQQDEIAANFSSLPENSPLILVGLEWSRLRAESKACIGHFTGHTR